LQLDFFFRSSTYKSCSSISFFVAGYFFLEREVWGLECGVWGLGFGHEKSLVSGERGFSGWTLVLCFLLFFWCHSFKGYTVEKVVFWLVFV
jgi:hypothetical protein